MLSLMEYEFVIFQTDPLINLVIAGLIITGIGFQIQNAAYVSIPSLVLFFNGGNFWFWKQYRLS